MNSIILFRFTSSVTNKATIGLALSVLLILGCTAGSWADVNQKLVEFTRAAAAGQAIHQAANSQAKIDPQLAEFGSKFFESKSLSNSNDIACLDCHLPEFGSSDGLPVSIGWVVTGRVLIEYWEAGKSFRAIPCHSGGGVSQILNLLLGWQSAAKG